MTLLHEAVDAKKFDVRMVERNVTRGVVSSEDAAKISKQLPDDADNGEWVSLESIAGESADSDSDRG